VCGVWWVCVLCVCVCGVCVCVCGVCLHSWPLRQAESIFSSQWAQPFFFTLSHKRHKFQEIFIEHELCFDSLYKSETFFILRCIQRHVVLNHTVLHVEYQLQDFKHFLKFSWQIFRKYSKIKFRVKIRPKRAGLLHAYRQKNMTTVTAAFANAPKMWNE